MKSLFRGFIFLAIVALLIAAYLVYEPTQSPPQNIGTIGGLPSITAFLETVSDKIPSLKNDLIRLSEDIPKRVGDIEIKESLSRLEDLKKQLLSKTPDVKLTWEEISADFKSLIQRLKELKAEDLAQRLETIYQQLKEKWEAASTPTKEPTP